MKKTKLTTGSTYFSERVQQFIKEAKNLINSENIIERNLLFALKIASNMANSRNTVDDLLSPALEGLIEAEKNYDPKKAKFTTWAYFKVKEKILLYIESKKDIEEEFEEFKFPIKTQPEIDTGYIAVLLSYLSIRERELIKDLFYKGFSYQSLSEKYGITGAGLKRREEKIIKKLQIIAKKI